MEITLAPDTQYLHDQYRLAHESLAKLEASPPPVGTSKREAWRWARRAERDTIQLLAIELGLVAKRAA